MEPRETHLSQLILWIGILVFLAGLFARSTDPTVSREDYVSILAEAGTLGHDVHSVVSAHGISRRSWAWSAWRHEADPTIPRDIEVHLLRLAAAKVKK